MADEETQEEQQQKTRTGAEQAAALDRVTDLVEEKEIKAVDTSKVKQAMAALAAQQKARLEAQKARDKELAAVKVAPQDVALIAAEFEVDKKKAELRLRECGGDVRAALASFLKV